MPIVISRKKCRFGSDPGGQLRKGVNIPGTGASITGIYIHEPDSFLAISSAGKDASGDRTGPYGNAPFSWHSSWPVCILLRYNMTASCSFSSGDYVARL